MMHQYIHSHLSYDEIIGEELGRSSQEKQSKIEEKTKKDKPFWIEKNKKNPHQPINMTQSFKGKINLANPESSVKMQQPQQLASKTQTIIYNSDFEVYQQQFYESIAKDIPIQKSANISYQFEPTQRKNNQSAILPNIRKHSPKKTEILNRYTEMAKQSNKINKSTIQIREQNKKIIRSIQNYRRIIPTYKKNQALLNEQREQLKKIKFLQMRCYDVDYEFNLDKNAQKSTASIADTQNKIKVTENGMKLRNNYKKWATKGLVMSRISRVQDCGQEEKVQLGEYLKLREEILYKKKQQQFHSKRLNQIEQKIAQYQHMLSELEVRARVGLHEQYKRRKIVLQYDIQLQKGKFQEKQCQLMLQISELNNKCSSIEVQIVRANSQIMHINTSIQKENSSCKLQCKLQSKPKQKRTVFKSLQQKRSQKSSQNSIATTTASKPVSRILRLFGRKK